MGKSTISMENRIFLMGKSPISMENHHFFMGKSTIFLWVIFKFASSVSQRHYQAGSNPYGLMTTVPLWLKKNYTAWWFFALPL